MSSDQNPRSALRWRLFKKAGLFQLKLGIDAIRDILFSPLSIILVLVDVLIGHDMKHSYFLRLMHYGRLSDHWINLFDSSHSEQPPQDNNVDHLIAQVETLFKEQRDKGTLSESAKAKIEQAIAKIRKRDHDV